MVWEYSTSPSQHVASYSEAMVFLRKGIGLRGRDTSVVIQGASLRVGGNRLLYQMDRGSTAEELSLALYWSMSCISLDCHRC
jgi:hypothetical protein